MNLFATLDHRHVWHPFTQMKDWLRREPIVISSGKGAALRDVHGKEYLDANSSIWTNLHGHAHPKINAAIQRQLKKIAHSSALGLDVTSPETPSVLGAILHIAEDYATFLRVAGSKTTAVHVLGAMAKDPGTLYHSSLMQLFVNALGKFPPGVMLGRADGSKVRSVSPVRSAEQFASPLVRPVDASGKELGPPMELTGGPAITKAWPG